MDLKWEEPPSIAHRGRGVSKEYQEILTELQKRPYQWAVVKEFTEENSGERSSTPTELAAASANNIRHGRIRGIIPATGHVEALSRNCKVYVRYVPA